MTIPADLLALLVCPQCKGPLDHQPDAARLVCPACRLAYPVRDEIPIMLVDEAQPL